MKTSLKLTILTMPVMLLLGCGHATQESGKNPDELKAEIAKAIPSLPHIDAINQSQATGLYEVISGGKVYYVTTDGKYLVFGNVIEVSTKKSLTAEREQQINAPAGKKQ